MSRFGRRIAFDYGDVRIGVAICDPDGVLATPLDFLLSKDPQLFEKITGLIAEFQPVKIYVGLPKQLSGSEDLAVFKAKEFSAKLQQRFGLEIAMIDERLSTVSAAIKLRNAGIDAKAAKSKIDSMAAVTILEQGLAIDKK